MKFLQNIEKYNYKKYQRMANEDIERFLSELKEIYTSKGFEDFLFVLKSSKILINKYQDSNKTKRNNLLIDRLDFIKKEEVKVLNDNINQIEFLNKLYNSYNIAIENLLNQINNEEELLNFITIIISSELEKFFGESLNQVKSKDCGKDEFSISQLDDKFSGMVDSISQLLKYNLYYKKRNLNEKKMGKIPKDEYSKIIITCLNLVSEQCVVDNYITFWSYSEIEIVKVRNKYILKSLDNDLSMYISIKNERTNFFKSINQSKILKNKEPSFFNIDKDNLKLIYHVSNFEEKIKDLTITQWLNAYYIIEKESENFRNNNKTDRLSTLNKHCFIRPQRKWEKKFTKSGFTKEQAETIINFFTFDMKSNDLMDTPFINIGGQENSILVLPEIPLGTYVSNTVFCNIVNKFNSEDSFRGFGFEETVLDLLKSSGIKGCSVMQNEQNKTYECDACFILEDVLYFIECKSHSMPQSFDSTVDQLQKLIKETNQINRIGDHFYRQKEYVLNKLGLDKNTEVNSYCKILLSATEIGASMLINDVFITDYSTLSTFFEKKDLVLRDTKGRRMELKRSSSTQGINKQSLEQVLKNLLLEDELKKLKKIQTISLSTNKDVQVELVNTHLPVVLEDSDSNKRFIADLFNNK